MQALALRDLAIGAGFAVAVLLLWQLPLVRPWLHGLGSLTVSGLLIVYAFKRSHAGWRGAVALGFAVLAFLGAAWLAVQQGRCEWSRIAGPQRALERLHSCLAADSATQFVIDGLLLGGVFLVSYASSTTVIRALRKRL